MKEVVVKNSYLATALRNEFMQIALPVHENSHKMTVKLTYGAKLDIWWPIRGIHGAPHYHGHSTRIAATTHVSALVPVTALFP
jgi:hypothetical protein